jgi:hypothetical protein
MSRQTAAATPRTLRCVLENKVEFSRELYCWAYANLLRTNSVTFNEAIEILHSHGTIRKFALPPPVSKHKRQRLTRP